MLGVALQNAIDECSHSASSLKDNLVDSVGLPYYEYMNFQRLT